MILPFEDYFCSKKNIFLKEEMHEACNQTLYICLKLRLSEIRVVLLKLNFVKGFTYELEFPKSVSFI